MKLITLFKTLEIPGVVRWCGPLLLILILIGFFFHWPTPLEATLALLFGFILGWIFARDPLIEHNSPSPGTVKEPYKDVLESFVQALDIPTIAVDTARYVLSFNTNAHSLFSGLAKKHPLALVSRNPELHQAIDIVLKKGEQEICTISDRLHSGRRYFVTVTSLEKPPVLLLQFQDKSEEALLTQMRSDFIANASHELRTPLTSIRGFIETLQGSAKTDETARNRFLHIMSEQSARMNRILDDLLSLSRLEMRAHLTPKDPVNIIEIVQKVISSLEPVSQEANIKLQVRLGEPSLFVRGDKDELEQVVQNLVHNGLKYGTPEGFVEVCVKRKTKDHENRHLVELNVIDNGPGISSEHLPRLTERFYRVDSARSREKGGTGLGLAIVKHILNRHKGELIVHSELGKGSTFTVILEESISS